MSKFHRLEVARVEPETRDAVAITFAVPPALADPFRFAAGQHLTLRADIDGQDVRRSYSICSGVQEGKLRIAVKRNPGGVFSEWANRSLKAGARARRAAADGALQRAARPPATGGTMSGSRRAAGSRRSSLSSRRRSRSEPAARFTLFYGNRASGTVMFKEELAALKDIVPDALQSRPRALARGAGHRAAAWPDRPREGRRADRALARSRRRRQRVRLRPRRNDAGGRRGAEGARIPRRESQDRALRDEHSEARASAVEDSRARPHRMRGDRGARRRDADVHAGEGQGEHSRSGAQGRRRAAHIRARAARARRAVRS